jgi:hypothetical protein
MDFVTKFLKDGAQNYNEFLSSTVPTILKDQIASEFATEEVKEREREEKKMMEQLQDLDRATSSESISSSASKSFVRQPTTVSVSNEKTPDFMLKFTQESKKLIAEGGKEFFNPNTVSNDKAEFRTRFDEIVFERDNSNPDVLQRT